MSNEQKLEQKEREEPETFTSKVITIGFFGGLFWGLMGYLAYLFNFIKVGPGMILSPWALGDWKNQTIGHLISILILAVISVIVAYVYNAVLAKVKHMMAGVIFGIVIWVIVFYLLNPIFPEIDVVQTLGRNTITTTLCLFILYGLFVGYSISFAYEEIRLAEEQEQ
jgi:tetrahydromethanopterin S-methyltransferase subunit G